MARTWFLMGIASLLLAISFIQIGNALTDGKNGTVFNSDGTGFGQTIAWTNPGNAIRSDNSYATSTITASDITYYLNVSNFGFGIPTGSTINGIVVNVERKGSTSSATKWGFDYSVKLKKDGAFIGNDKADLSTKYPTSDTLKTYGSSSDLWGTTWTAEDINSGLFGVGFSSQMIGTTSLTVSVDYINITIFYTAPVITNKDCTISTIGGNSSIPCNCQITRKFGNIDILSVNETGGNLNFDTSNVTIRKFNITNSQCLITANGSYSIGFGS